ncbi:MAG: hypothetical protein M3264_10365 [Thermoproteota archaeon]|nr:hypothetical protein [Thermoproteota archaeon]
MAIVKASYTTIPAGAKASIRYIEHRPGKEGAKITRNLFGIDGLMGRDQAYRLIDEAPKGSMFYRFILSPDPKLEDTRRDLHLRDMTEKTIQALERRLKQEVQWVAAEHDDHAPNRHVHVVAVVKGKLHIPDFEAMRERATEAALFQRRERDLVQRYQLDKNYLRRSFALQTTAFRPIGMAEGRAIRRARQQTLACSNGMGHETVKLKSGKSWCRDCEQVLEQSAGLSL